MALIAPDLPPLSATSLGGYAEVLLIKRLASELPDAYRVFHSVEWSEGAEGSWRHGEIDIVLMNQAGHVLILEVKSGEVEFEDGRCFKRYASVRKNVSDQVKRQFSSMRRRLDEEGLKVPLHQLLVLPDVTVIAGSVLFPRSQIVDASDMASFAQRVDRAIGGVGLSEPAVADRVCAFLENTFQVVPNVAHQINQVHVASRRLAEGLATWVPRIDTPSGIVRVDGTAGSGKTQLALALLRDARIKGLRAAYLCFNRPLADHMVRLAPASAQVETFHELAVRTKERSDPDWRVDQRGAFDAASDALLTHLAGQSPDLDLLILDEVQDLQPEWVEGLLKRLTHSGRAYLLEDPDQQLYLDRTDFAIEDAVQVHCPDNFRSPRQLVRLINHLELTRQEIKPCGPVEGEVPEPIEYADERDLVRATVQAVTRCLAKGFDIKDIVVVTFRGRERSILHARGELGDWHFRRATGAFDTARNPIWTEGELTLESMRRFKGQSAPAVVLTECDFEDLDALNRRMLFVGMTRAQLHLEWVLSRSASRAVAKTLGR